MCFGRLRRGLRGSRGLITNSFGFGVFLVGVGWVGIVSLCGICYESAPH